MGASVRSSRRSRAPQAFWGAVLLVGTLASWHGGAAHAQGRDAAAFASERGVKAAFLYKFPSFVAWPDASFAQPEAPFVLAVVDADEIAAELTQITAGRQVQEHPVEIRRVRASDPLNGVHMVFVGRGEPARLQQIARTTQNRPILVASEQEGALDHGSMINLLLREGRVRFEVGLDAAEKHGLKLSSRMLALALQVRGSAHEDVAQIRTVRAKVILVVLATTLVSLLVAGVALVVNERKAYDEQLTSDLTAQADIIARASAPALAFDDPRSAREDLALLRARPQIIAAAIYLPNGTLFATYPADVTGLPPLPGADGFAIHDEHVDVFQRIVDGKEILGTVFLRSRYELSSRLQAYIGILAGVLIAGLLVALAMSAWLQSTVTKPIVAVANAAHEVVESRRFSLRVKRTTDDEIGYLVDSFNEMLSEIGQRQDALQLANQTLEREMLVRRSAEQALREADQRKDEFLATLAHELRNPLAPLRNALEILRQTPPDADTARVARAMMERQLGQMVRLVDDLLDVSRITVGKLVLKTACVDFRAVVDNAIAGTRTFIEQQRHTLTLDMPDHPLLVDGDATRLEQVVGNVLNNAAKYTDPGGQISVRVEEEPAGIVLRIADTGIGIAADMLTGIFAMFAQADRALERSRAGLGVGLTLARRLVELHGGSIEAHSEGAGRGSEFVIRLPALRLEPAAPSVQNPVAAPVASAGRKVLVADDNADFADSFALILDALGYAVVVAHDGEEALRLATAEKPAIAFLDIGLPKLHGFDLAQRLRSAFSRQETTLIAVSGWGQADDRRRAFEAGFDYHFVKPVAFDQVEEVLRDPLRFREKFAAGSGQVRTATVVSRLPTENRAVC